MEEDSFAFYIFSGFVAISTVISWAIVTYITRENTYENAKRQAQEDMSWMENAQTHNTSIKSNIKITKIKKTAVKSIKSKGGHVEHQVSAVVTTSQRKVPAPVVKAVQKQNAPVSTKTVTVTSPKTEILENKSKAVKKPKESASKPTTSSVTQQKEIKPGQAAPKVKKEKMQLQKIDIWADEEINYEAWQAVPMKSVKATAAAGSKSTNKNSSTATGKSAASKKQPPESAPEKDKEKEKKSQANQKLEVSLPSRENRTGASAQLSASSNVTNTEPSAEHLQKSTSQLSSKLNVKNIHVHASSPYISNCGGEGSSPVSDGLEHSDSTEELIEGNTFTATGNINASKAVKAASSNLPPSSEKSSSNAKLSNKPKPNKVIEEPVKAAESKQLSASASARSKHNSERSAIISAASVAFTDKKSKEGGKHFVDTPEIIQIRKLEDELKRERNHSQDLRNKFLQLSDQIEKEKKTSESVNQQLMLRVQENSELKSRIAQFGARSNINVVPTVVSVNNEELQNLRAEMKRGETKFMALKNENDVLRNELGSTKASLHGAKHEYQLQVQSAEAQLKQIEMKNKELQEQCNKYQMQLRNHLPAPPTPTTNNSTLTHNQFTNQQDKLLAQLTDPEDKVKVLKRENDLLKQQHEATYAEMSRLTDSKIALQKHNSSLQEEVQKLQHELSCSPTSEIANGTGPIDTSASDATPNYDWSQVNSDLKKLAQLEVTVANLSQENESLKEENARLEKIHSSSALQDSSCNHLQNGDLNHEEEDTEPEEEQGQEESTGMNGVAHEVTSNDPAQDIISLKEVETELKNCVLRVYPDISNTTSMQSDCIAFIAQFEKHARSSLLQLSEQEDKLSQQVVSLKDEISKVISEKDHLAQENERYLNALNKTEEFVSNLEYALTKVEAEHKELTEENNILRHDTDKAVELQIELDQVKLEMAKLQQNQGELQSKAESIAAQHSEEQSRAEALDDNLQSLQSKFDILQEEKSQIEQKLLQSENKINSDLSAKSSLADAHLEELAKKAEEDELVIKDLQEKCDSQVAKVQMMEEKLDSYEKQVADMQSEMQQNEVTKNQQSKNILEKEKTIACLNAEKSDMEEKIRELESKLEERYSAQKDVEQRLCNDVKIKDEELNKLKAKVSELQNSVAQCEPLKGEVEQLNSRLTETNQELEKKNEEIEARNKEIGSLKEILDANADSSDKKVKEFQQKCSDLSEEICNLEKNLDSKIKEVNELKNNLDSKTSEVGNLKNSLNSNHSEINDLKSSLESTKSAFNLLKNKLDSKSCEVHEKTKSIEDKNRQVDSLQQELSQLKGQLPELQMSVSEREREVENLKIETTKLERSLEEKEKNIQHFTDQNAQSLNSVKQERDQAECKINELEKQLSTSAEKYEQEKQQLQKQLTEVEQSKKGVEEKLKEAERELADAKKSLNEALASAATVASIASAIDSNSDTQSIGSTLSAATSAAEKAANDQPEKAGKDKEKEKSKKDKGES